MKNDRIVHAYDKNAPDQKTEERIWRRISMEADTESSTHLNTKPKRNDGFKTTPVMLVAQTERPLLRRAGLIAACAVLTVSVLAGGYFGFQELLRSEPQNYLPGASGAAPVQTTDYVVPEHTENTELRTNITETSGPSTEEMQKMREDRFRLQAIKVLEQAGFTNLMPEDATVQEIAPSYEWEREQVAVSWPDSDTPISVLFDAKDIVFLRVFGFDWVLRDGAPCATQEDADALAQKLFHSLPVNQDYVMDGCEKYDDEFWTYDFCRELEPGLYSHYECVRLSVNPTRGEAQFIKVFYVPLLDDHAPDAVPLTEEEALHGVGIDPNSAPDLKNSGRLSIKKSVTIPHRLLPDDRIEPANCSDVSFLCWKIEYHEPESEDYIAGGWVKYVDYYSGEIINYDYFG